MEFVINPDKISISEKKQLYLRNIKPIILKDALFADETKDYAYLKNDQMILRFRTGKDNVDHVYLCYENDILDMTKKETEGLFDYYEIQIALPKHTMNYYFKVCSGKMCVFYNKRGAQMEHISLYDFRVIPEFHVPEWAKGAVFYQIFVDRFCNGDPQNDVEDNEYIYINEGVKRIRDWDALPEVNDVRRFYGGDLQGVMDKLDYLQELGVEVVYLNPIFVSPSNHKYDIQDYDYVDPHFGKIVHDSEAGVNGQDTKFFTRVTEHENLEASNALFAELTEEIHRRGMKVVLDGVFNHCGSFNKWMDREHLYDKNPKYEKGAYVTEESPYKDFFIFKGGQWPDNDEYACWWDHLTLPKLNYNSPKLYNYILGIAKKWLAPPYNVDGWRLDVAADLGETDELNHQFWRDFRKAVKEVNPEAIILAEHYGNPSAWLQGDQWDTVMNYDAFMEPFTWFFTGLEKHSDLYREDMYGNVQAFKDAMQYHMNSMHADSLYIAMNEISNHDHSRFLTRTNHRVGRLATIGSEAASRDLNYGIFREAVVAQMTWPGAPTIYYGDEAGVCGWTDPDNRRTYPWGHEDQALIDFHKEMIRIHKENDVLKTGSLLFLDGGYQWMAYGRFDRTDQMVMVFNNHCENQTIRIPVWPLGVGDRLDQIMETDENGYHLGSHMYEVKQGHITVTMKPYSALVLKSKK